MKNKKLLIIIIVVLAFVFIGVGVGFALSGSSINKDKTTDEKVDRMNEVHTKDNIKVTSFSIRKNDTNSEKDDYYDVSVNIVNETGKQIVSGKIDFKLLSKSGEKRDYTAFISELADGDSFVYTKEATFDMVDFYDYEMEVVVSDTLQPMGY